MFLPVVFNNRLAAGALTGLLLLGSCAVLDEMARPGTAVGQPSEARIAAGLREALLVASRRASQQVGRPGGYLENDAIRIPLPPTLDDAATQLRRFGLGGKADELQQAMNRAAEAAADEAVAVFADSIRQMRPSDVYAVFTGADDAATSYLRTTSEDRLRQRYQPIVAERLRQVQGIDLYRDIASAWNRLPAVTPLETDLEAFVTEKALDGLFAMIAREEARIRDDPGARSTEILREVFGSR
ncbi:MAG: DUF4197 domain-containing protein [Wenzhouxiangellaceae bacterium]|nr:DUF4197 domain-containing protein [Wenzhouxiangellaceae bacterium]